MLNEQTGKSTGEVSRGYSPDTCNGFAIPGVMWLQAWGVRGDVMVRAWGAPGGVV